MADETYQEFILRVPTKIFDTCIEAVAIMNNNIERNGGSGGMKGTHGRLNFHTLVNIFLEDLALTQSAPGDVGAIYIAEWIQAHHYDVVDHH